MKTVLFRQTFLLILFMILPLQGEELLKVEKNHSHITLQQYLRQLRQKNITSFPSHGKFTSHKGISQPFHRRWGKVTLIALGNHENQLLSELHISLRNPEHSSQNQRWIDTISTSLSILYPKSSTIERLIAINRTLQHQRYLFHSLILSSYWDNTYGRVMVVKTDSGSNLTSSNE